MKRSTISSPVVWILIVMITSSLASQPDGYKRMSFPGISIPFRHRIDSLSKMPPGFNALPKRPLKGLVQFPQNRPKGPRERLERYHASRSLIDTVQPDWIRYYGAQMSPSADWVSDITIDRLENVYVTGTSDAAQTGGDYTTVKYRSDGIQEWVSRYTSAGDSYDQAAAIGVDNSGNVYVTGTSESDYVTLKYNSLGHLMWEKRFDGPGHGVDVPMAIEIDGEGSIYVVGTCYSDSTEDIATIKYSSAGEIVWVERFEGEANSWEWPNALVLDSLGNVYIAGSSRVTTMSDSTNYLTVKYTPRGELAWAARYDGPVNLGDAAQSMVVSSTGNVYVTGTSRSSTGDDYATVKYNSLGVQQWIARYDGPAHGNDNATSLGIDMLENIYVTGVSDSDSSDDFVTIKYDSSGGAKWSVRRSEGMGYEFMYSAFLKIGLNDDIFISGSKSSGGSSFFTTLKYSSTGQEQWSARYQESEGSYTYLGAIEVDGLGNVWVAGNIGFGYGANVRTWEPSDFAVVKYGPSGSVLHEMRFDGPGTDGEVFSDMIVDSFGNSIVTGLSGGTPIWEGFSGGDWATIKYDPQGAQLWIVRHTLEGNDYAYGGQLATDASGNIYLAGETGGDWRTIKYNSSGEQQWVAQYSGPGGFFDWVSAIDVDRTGNVYVGGYSNSVGMNSLVTVKYNNLGQQQWVVRRDSGSAQEVACDAFGNVYVAGALFDPSNYNGDFATFKFDPDGREEWVARYDGSAHAGDWIRGMVLDSAGNVYVTGRSQSPTSTDIVTIKYSSLGNQQWLARHTDPGNVDVDPFSLDVDAEGNVYVVGRTHWLSGGATALAYDVLGREKWVVRDDLGYSFYSIVLDKDEGFYATDGVRIVRFSQTGEVQSKYVTVNPTYEWSTFDVLGLDLNGNIYAAGTDWGWGGGPRYWAMKVPPMRSTSVDKDPESNPAVFSLSQNYPNPFNPSTEIQYVSPLTSHVSLKIFDLLGQEVATLVNEALEPGSYKATWEATGFPSGVYFYQLRAGQFMQTKRLVLVR